MAALAPMLKTGQIVHYDYDFGPPRGKRPKFLIVISREMVFYKLLAINSEYTPWQLNPKFPERKDQIVTIDQKSHAFLEKDSLVNCGQILVEKMRLLEQHIREKPKEGKGTISNDLRNKIVDAVNNNKKLSAEEKEEITKSLLGM